MGYSSVDQEFFRNASQAKKSRRAAS